jgi:hypothetical protein
MSGVERDIPPVGEEIHLPGPLSIWISIIGVILFVITTAMWIRDTRRGIDELPEEHRH